MSDNRTNTERFTTEQRAVRTQELFETFRRDLLEVHFPRSHIIQLHQDPLVDCWTDACRVTVNLRTLLPFGRFITQQELQLFVDRDLPQIRTTSREQLWYWHLAANTTHLNQPFDRLVISPDEDRFWHSYVYSHLAQVKTHLEQGTHLFWLDRFILDHQSIEIGFNEIRLSTHYSHALPAHLAVLAPYTLVVTDGREYHLTWTEGHWNSTLHNPDPNLIDPLEYTLAPVIPASVALSNALVEEGAILEPTPTVAEPTEDSTLPPSDDDDEGWATPEPSLVGWGTAVHRITHCWCRGELCTCGYRPDTPQTPPGIVLWNPRSSYLPHQPGERH